ncbi:MAG: CdaR family protein [Bacilli bacterium]
MKTILKKIKNFFDSIWTFIDKKIITPITKFILRITKNHDGSGKTFENWLSKKNTILFISLFLAVVMFIVIDLQIVTFSKNSAEVLRSLPVKALYNEEAYVAEGLPSTVDITLIGSKTDLFIAKQMSSYDVTVDLTELKPGSHKVNIKYNQSLTNLEYMVNPSSINVTIYDKVSQTKDLSVDVLNKDKLDPKLVIDTTSVETDKVIIKGAEHQLKQVASVKALFDIKNLVSQEVGKQTVKDVPLKAYDEKGNVVNVEIVPSKIDVDVNIVSPSKELPIRVIPSGNVAFGKAITSLETSISKVTVYGSKDVLETLNYLPLQIDVTDLKVDKEYKVDLSKPVGITYMSTNSVTISIKLGNVSERDISNIKVVSRNLAAGLNVSASSQEATAVTVNLKGVSSVINGISSDDIVAYINLEGLGVGTHEVEVVVEGNDSRVLYLSKTKKVTININKK